MGAGASGVRGGWELSVRNLHAKLQTSDGSMVSKTPSVAATKRRCSRCTLHHVMFGFGITPDDLYLKSPIALVMAKSPSTLIRRCPGLAENVPPLASILCLSWRFFQL